MNPLSLFKTLWAHKLIAIPMVLLIVGACGYALFFGPRSYESSASYVLITPGMPSESQMEADPSLAQKADNPYLRAVDPSLAAQVVVARLGAADIGDALVGANLSADYAVLPASEFGSGQIIRVSSSADTPEKAEATTARLGEMLESELRSIQVKNGGDPSYYLTAQAITSPAAAVERVSSRLRTVAFIGIAGVVLLFGAVSFARALDDRRRRDDGRHEMDLPNRDRLNGDRGPLTTDVDMFPVGAEMRGD
ncbi:hypothetical protein [Nocardia sp. 348MFTsu5.1]|uniref:hypothetical protein n=1 Tax=Nocardia sp. 348MFTsu5.1 TaxID=1172185 RepID=UPI0003652AEB|nr:hypothetical protein [Nocardia sp. 348MFTsu5.1]